MIFHVRFRYDHYCQGWESVLIEKVVRAGSYEQAKAWIESEYNNVSDCEDITLDAGKDDTITRKNYDNAVQHERRN